MRAAPSNGTACLEVRIMIIFTQYVRLQTGDTFLAANLLRPTMEIDPRVASVVPIAGSSRLTKMGQKYGIAPTAGETASKAFIRSCPRAMVDIFWELIPQPQPQGPKLLIT